MHQLQLHASALENNSSNSNSAIDSEKALRVAAETAANRTAESLDVYKNNNKALTAKLAASSSEINKGNEVISKVSGRSERALTATSTNKQNAPRFTFCSAQLSSEYRSNKQKLKMKSELLRNQELVMADRESTITTMGRKMTAMESEVERMKSTAESLTAELGSAKGKLSESSKLLDSNQQVITWLNREINEAQIGKINSYGGAPSSAAGLSANKFQPSFTPNLKVSHGLNAYVSPEGGGGGGGGKRRRRSLQLN